MCIERNSIKTYKPKQLKLRMIYLVSPGTNYTFLQKLLQILLWLDFKLLLSFGAYLFQTVNQ